MVHILCTALLDNAMQIENLRQCIVILGGKPCISGNSVCVEYTGNSEKTDKFVELFDQYPHHGIVILREGR